MFGYSEGLIITTRDNYSTVKTVKNLRELVESSVQSSLEAHLKKPNPLTAYPIKEAAELLGVYFHTLRVYAEQGIIQHYMVGNRYYFTLEAIQDFIDKGGSRQPTQPRAYKKPSKSNGSASPERTETEKGPYVEKTDNLTTSGRFWLTRQLT